MGLMPVVISLKDRTCQNKVLCKKNQCSMRRFLGFSDLNEFMVNDAQIYLYLPFLFLVLQMLF